MNASASIRRLNAGFAPAIQAVLELAARGMAILPYCKTRKIGAPNLLDVIESHDPRFVAAISDAMSREATLAAGFYAWRTPIPRALARARRAIFVEPAAAFALSTVSSGYVREVAVRQIASVPGPFCLALLVYRLNDWVIEVRRAALEKLRALAPSLPADLILQSVEVFWDFGRFDRVEAGASCLIDEILARPDIIARIRSDVLTLSTERSAYLFRHVLRSPALDADLPNVARNHRHPNVRALAMRALLRGEHTWTRNGRQRREIGIPKDAADLARAALADKSPRVRLAGVEYIVSNAEAFLDADALLLARITDRSAPVAELAQWALTKRGVAWLSTLRERLPDIDAARVLGAVGEPTDAHAISEQAAHTADYRISLQLFAAAARLGDKRALTHLGESALRLDDRHIALYAASLLKQSGGTLSVDALALAADQGQEFFNRGLEQHLVNRSVIEQLIVAGHLERAGVCERHPALFRAIERKRQSRPFLPTASELDQFRKISGSCPTTRLFAEQLGIS